MEIRLLDNNKDEMKLSFILKDSNPAYANTLRRLMMEEVPVITLQNLRLKSGYPEGKKNLFHNAFDIEKERYGFEETISDRAKAYLETIEKKEKKEK
jgi:hypothetical protein